MPAFILIGLAVLYLRSGAPVAIEMSAQTFFPTFGSMSTLVVFVAFILSYMGVEASATHVNEMKNMVVIMFFAMLSASPPCLSSLGGFRRLHLLFLTSKSTYLRA